MKYFEPPLNHGERVGECCGSALIYPDKPFKMIYGIIIGEGSREYTGKPQDTFAVVETKNGPISIATRSCPLPKEKVKK